MNNEETDSDGEVFDPYYEAATVPITLDVRKPASVCYDHGGRPLPEHRIAKSGTLGDGTTYVVSITDADSEVYVEFADGPMIELNLTELALGAAVKAAQARGYEVAQKGDRALEVQELVGDTVAALAIEGFIPDTENVGNVLHPDALARFEAAIED